MPALTHALPRADVASIFFWGVDLDVRAYEVVLSRNLPATVSIIVERLPAGGSRHEGLVPFTAQTRHCEDRD